MNETRKNSRTQIGEVISNAMNKTRVVLIKEQVKHPTYGKYIRKSTKIHAHDEHNLSHKGDIVMIKECRPLSKTKNWDLVEVIEKSTEQGLLIKREKV